MGKFKYNINEVKSPKDVDPALIARLEKTYGPVKDTDFFNDDLDIYYKTSSVDKETGGVEHEIIELASFGDSLEKLSNATKALKLLMSTKDAKDDESIQKIARELKDVFNKYRTHLRKNYPDQYDQIKSTLEEISTTGGGAGAASFTPGTGMQYATPYAFRKKGSKPNDKIYKKMGYKTVNESQDKWVVYDIKTKKLLPNAGKSWATLKAAQAFADKQENAKVASSTFYFDRIIKEGIGANLGPGPIATEDGVKDNAYVKQFKYKLVPKDKNGNYVQKGSGLEVKQLFEAETPEEFQKKRIEAFDLIENELNDVYKMLSNAKNETVDYYNTKPSSYAVVRPTDLILDYIKDIKDLLKGE